MHWIQDTTPEVKHSYRGPVGLAQRYKQLAGRAVEESGTGFDIKTCYIASHDAGGGVSNWTPLDHSEELAMIRRVLRMAREDLDRERPSKSQRWWSVWAALRLEGIKLKAKPGGYSEDHAARVRNKVDRYVSEAMDFLDCLDTPDVEVARTRTFINPDAFTEEE